MKRLVTLLPLLLAAPLAEAGILTVGPSGTFPDIQPAIDAAMPGDVLLIEPGLYSEFVLNKSLRLYGQPGATVQGLSTAAAPVTVTGIAADEHAMIAGLSIGPSAVSCLFASCPSAEIVGNAGTIVLQELDAVGVRLDQNALVVMTATRSEGFGSAGPGYGVSVATTELWLVGCELEGGGASSTFYDTTASGPGLIAEDAAVYVAESTVRGGDGGTIVGSCFGGPTFVGLSGSPGIEAGGGSFVKVVSGPGQTITGGSGGFTSSGCPGAGAPGVRLTGTAQLLAVDSIAIAGGLDYGSAVPKPPVEVNDAAASVQTALTYPLLSAPTSTSPGATVALNASGNPGASLVLFAALSPSSLLLIPGVDGATLLDPSQAVAFGAVPLSVMGSASFPLALPAVPTLVGLLAVFQGVELGGPQTALTNPAFVTIL
ncbi:MAG: hypothetical protein AAF682_01420 [Planctomycetota bacterium]